MGNPVVHFEIIGKDQQVLENFYKSIFDWQIAPRMKGYSLVDTGSGIGGGIGAMPESPCNVTFYVEVADIAATLRAVEKLGGHAAYGPETVPGGPMVAGFVDPEGHLIGLVQQQNAS